VNITGIAINSGMRNGADALPAKERLDLNRFPGVKRTNKIISAIGRL
jgi:hypothetical protein